MTLFYSVFLLDFALDVADRLPAKPIVAKRMCSCNVISKIIQTADSLLRTDVRMAADKGLFGVDDVDQS